MVIILGNALLYRAMDPQNWSFGHYTWQWMAVSITVLDLKLETNK